MLKKVILYSIVIIIITALWAGAENPNVSPATTDAQRAFATGGFIGKLFVVSLIVVTISGLYRKWRGKPLPEQSPDDK